MAIEKQIVGKRMSKRRRMTATGDDIDLSFNETLSAWNNLLDAGKGSFGAVTMQARRKCQKTIDESGDGEAKGIAAGILQDIDLTDACIAQNNADESARMAFHAGMAYALALSKFAWERDAMEGERIDNARRDRSAEARDKNSTLLREYDRLRESGIPSKEALARLAEQRGVTYSTVESRVKRAQRARKNEDQT